MEPEDLIASWTLVKADWDLATNKTGATRLGFSVLLKFFEIDGRFPEYTAEVPDAGVAYLAEQVEVDPALFAKYELSSHGPNTTAARSARSWVPRVRER